MARQSAAASRLFTSSPAHRFTMRGHSHIIAGFAVALAAQQVYPYLPLRDPLELALCGGAIVLGALLPDIDSATSTIREDTGAGPRPGQTADRVLRTVGLRRGLFHAVLRGVLWLFFALFSLIVNLVVHVVAGRHRGRTHTLLALGLLLAGAAYLDWPAWALAGCAGYASHLLADSFTRSGIPLFWPLSEWRFHLTPRLLWITTGTWPEYVIVFGMLVWIAYSVYGLGLSLF
jgi:inner membrane protein